MNIHLPPLRAVVAGVEAAVLSWLVAVLGALVTYVATAAAPALGEVTWSSMAALGTGWWTLAFGGHLPLEEGAVTLAPLGITALCLVLLRGAQHRLAVDTLAGVTTTAGSFTVTVAVVGLVAGQGSGTHVAGALGVGILAGLWTLGGRPNAASRRARTILGAAPAAFRAGLDAAAVAVVAALGLGFALVVVAVVAGWGQVIAIHGSLEPDVASGIVLTLVQAAYLPNLVLWALGWLAGPGFEVGQGTVYSALGSTTELLPAIPVLGALPAPGMELPWVLAVPALLGALVGGWRTGRRPLTEWRDALLATGTFALCMWAVFAVLGTMASGSIGPGRLASVGLHGPLVAFVLVGGVTGGYTLVLLLRLPATRDLARRLGARLRPADVPSGDAGGPSSPATPVPSPAVVVSATTAPTAVSPSGGAEPVR